MIFKFFFGVVFILSISYACNTAKDEKVNISKADSSTSKLLKQEITLGVFQSIPDTIDGCGDYYSYDSIQFKSGRYIFLSRMGEIAVVLVNGKQVYLKNIPELSISEDKLIHEEFLGEGIKGVLDLELIRQYEEGGFFSGTLTIIWKSNRTVFKVYGQTGC